jgi:anti-sigma regulatory factor (Ser/Thr protein kinase)
MSLRLTIPPHAQEVGRARQWFRSCLRAWHADGAAAAEAVFAEVAANAVRHGRGRVTMTVQLSPAGVRCDIRDSGWRSPRVVAARRPDLEHGRGMIIIATLADSWGVRRHLRGKTVWFEVRARHDHPPPSSEPTRTRPTPAGNPPRRLCPTCGSSAATPA